MTIGERFRDERMIFVYDTVFLIGRPYPTRSSPFTSREDVDEMALGITERHGPIPPWLGGWG